MSKFTKRFVKAHKKSNFSHKRGRKPFKRPIRIRRLSSFDRLYLNRKRASRLTQIKSPKTTRPRLARNQLYYLGTNGGILVSRFAAVLWAGHLEAKWRTSCKKARIARALVYPRTPRSLRARTLAYSMLRRARLHFCRGGRWKNASSRSRAAAYSHSQNLRVALTLHRLLVLRRWGRRKSPLKATTRWHKRRQFKKQMARLNQQVRGRGRFRPKTDRPEIARVQKLLLRRQYLKNVIFRHRRGFLRRTPKRRAFYCKGLNRKVVRRRRRSRRKFADQLTKRGRRYLKRRDVLSRKRFYSQSTLSSTALLQLASQRARLRLLRVKHSWAAGVLPLRSTSRLHVATAFLRVALRRTISYRKRRGPSAQRRRRVDIVARRLSARGVYVRVVAITTSEKARFFLKASRSSRTKYLGRWFLARQRAKLVAQQQLRYAVINDPSRPRAGAVSTGASVRAILQSRSRPSSSDRARSYAQRFARSLSAARQPAATPRGHHVTAPIVAANRRAVRRGAVLKRRLSRQRFGFLSNSAPARRARVAELIAHANLLREQRKYAARRILRKQPSLRLPATRVTRVRRRRSGLVAFVRNSLKQPKTLLGIQRQLLPPSLVYSAVHSQNVVGHTVPSTALRAYEHREDKLPIFWKRPYSRANMRAIGKVRRTKYNRHKRYYLNTRQKMYRQTAARPFSALPTPEIKPKRTGFAAAQSATAISAAYSQNSTPNSFHRVVPISKKNKDVALLKRASSVSSRTIRHIRALSSTTSNLGSLMSARSAPRARRLQGLWHARSARAMLSSERAASAWTPQLSAKTRRRYHPRIGVFVSPQRWVGSRTRRLRRLDNKWRLRRGIPQVRYTDNMRIKLQYYFGSVGSAGYARFRRVHRAHTEHSRWWRPVKRGVPFAHPFSRRDLVATRHRTVRLSKVSLQATKGFAQPVSPRAGTSLHTKFPPRVIPWRNFRYRRPRNGSSPSTLRRWTFTLRDGKTSRTQPTTSKTIIARTPREVHNLHKYVSSSGVYYKRRWNLLDNAAVAASATAQINAAIAEVPSRVWSALFEVAGCASAYTAIRTSIFVGLRTWLQKRNHAFSDQTVLGLKCTLVKLLRTAISSRKRALAALSADHRHSVLRSTGFASRAEYKARQYLKLRELPRLNAPSLTNDVLVREQSRAYKHWLSGVEGALKRTQSSYVPTSRSRYTDNVATAFGRRRARFPASGRRRKSYDSLLHAFVKKVAPSRFRRVTRLRFHWAGPSLLGEFQHNISMFTPLFGSNRRRWTAQQLSAVAYLSAPTRGLIRYRNHTLTGSLPGPVNTFCVKRRFLALPTQTAFAERQRIRRATTPLARPYMYGMRSSILRRALRRRRKERAYVDLRHFARQRRLPKERALNRRSRRRKLRRRAAAKRGPYSRRGTHKRRQPVARWRLRHLSAVATRRRRRRPCRLPPTLSHGEDVAIQKNALLRGRKAVRGFVLPTHSRVRLRARRTRRDVLTKRLRTRRARRKSRRGTLRRTRHWSEKKDLRLRGNMYGHRRITLAKVVSKKLRGKLGSRFLQKRSVLGWNPRLSKFSEYKSAAVVGKIPAFGGVQVGVKAFTDASYRHSSERAWALREKSRMSWLQFSPYKLYSNLARHVALKRALLTAKASCANSIPKQLVSTVDTFDRITPLWFETLPVSPIKSDAVKMQEALAAIAAKEVTFQLPMQYVETVTTLIPEFINYMLSRKIKTAQLTYQTTKQTIRNIYWSLRVYLNVDPFDTRFFARDKVPAARVHMFETLTDLSLEQKALQPQRAAFRYRFQPARIVRSRSKLRFRGDWLRAFFPARHALYQENDEDYGRFLLTTHKIRRLRIGPRGMASWGTEHQLFGDESRARQLLKLRLSKRRRRFETVLQTTRRIPDVERSPSAPSTARESFFARAYTTYSARGLGLTTRWIHRQKRFVELETGWRTVTPVARMSARNRVISRIELLGKMRYFGKGREGMTVSLADARFARAKSPRSRQYVLRAHKILTQASKQKKITNIEFYKAILAGKEAPQSVAPRWTRVQRRTWSPMFRQRFCSPEINEVRETSALLRAHTLLALPRKRSLVSARRVTQLRRSSARTAAVTYKKSLALPFASVYALPQFTRLRRVSKTLSGRVVTRHKRRRFTANFVSAAGFRAVQNLDLARACVIVSRRQRQAPFEAHRPRLWNKLTLRWKKKLRIGKHWIRETSHWLRDPWLSKIVATDMSLHPDRFGGELRSRPQQVGEYVPEVDAYGRDIRRKKAPKERHKFQRILPEIKDRAILQTDRILKRGSSSDKVIAIHRLRISAQARRKPVPTMRLANYELRDVIREHREEKAKSAKQKAEEEAVRVKAYWARKAKKLPPIRPRRLPLKHPANLWLPHVIWKDIQRRVRKFEWRESDQVFARRGFRNAFRFRPAERRKASWLEPLMYTRAAYSTRLKEFRRRQFPHEQKKYKWLQRVRRSLYPGRRNKYVSWRRWPQLRRYNQKLHYSLFNLRDWRASRRHFKKLNNRTKPAISSFISKFKGLTNKLDVTCLQMRFAPTSYWARIVSEFGLLRVNGRTVYDPSYQLQPADIITPNWDTVARFQHYFKPYLGRRAARRRRNRASTTFYPTNMEYHRGTQAIIYKHAPEESDLRNNGRIRATYLRWFKLDSV